MQVRQLNKECRGRKENFQSGGVRDGQQDLRARPVHFSACPGAKGCIFPSSAGANHIVAESLGKAYRETLALRGKHTPHSWRSALSTLARDNGFERDVVEITLDHIHDNDVLRACDCGERLQQRIKLMNCWCAQLADAATRRTGPTS